METARHRPAEAPVVFVVDDDASTLSLLCDVAEDAGWVARGFTRLRDAWSRIGTDPPSLVIVDDDLPDGRGGDLARHLNGDGLGAVPVVVCTAAAPPRQAEIGRWAPVIAKPFELSEIERLLASAVRHPPSGLRGGATG